MEPLAEHFQTSVNHVSAELHNWNSKWPAPPCWLAVAQSASKTSILLQMTSEPKHT